MWWMSRWIQSDDGKQVRSTESHSLPDNPRRFSICSGVLGKPSFSSGRFYYEVQVGVKTEWDVGVARERSGTEKSCPQNTASGRCG